MFGNGRLVVDRLLKFYRRCCRNLPQVEWQLCCQACVTHSDLQLVLPISVGNLHIQVGSRVVDSILVQSKGLKINLIHWVIRQWLNGENNQELSWAGLIIVQCSVLNRISSDSSLMQLELWVKISHLIESSLESWSGLTKEYKLFY